MANQSELRRAGNTGLWLTMVALVSSCALLAQAPAKVNRASIKDIPATITRIRDSSKTQTERTDAAERLSKLTRRSNANTVDDATLRDIISLLDSDEDGVRAWVAASLGNLGPRAKAAVPKLLAILPDADCLTGSLTSAPAIRSALIKIGVTPPATKCRDSAGLPYPQKR